MLFEIGEVHVTPAAMKAMVEEGRSPYHFLARHMRGDWGDMDDFDKQQNDNALKHGGRLFSAYNFKNIEGQIWVITEADRSVTTLLLPEDY